MIRRLLSVGLLVGCALLCAGTTTSNPWMPAPVLTSPMGVQITTPSMIEPPRLVPQSNWSS